MRILGSLHFPWRRGDKAAFSFSLGIPIAAIVLVDATRNAWMNVPAGAVWSQYATNLGPLWLAILALSWFEIRSTKRRLLEGGHSGWWSVPLFLALAVTIVFMPDAGTLRSLVGIGLITIRYRYSSTPISAGKGSGEA
ncbi:MAG: hypothetical protein ABSH37_16190 [Bryobacteraceae bacterium]|jgi:uncharacterized membrane protein YhaH (DUF805 family)